MSKRNQKLYNRAMELQGFMPFGHKVLAAAVDRGSVPVGFFDMWLAGLDDEAQAKFLEDVDNCLVVAATSSDIVGALRFANPTDPRNQRKQLTVDVKRLRARFGGAIA